MYALAAFKALPVELDAVDRRLKQARGKRPSSEGQAPAQQSRRRGPIKPKDTGYDDW